jgi:hypothetical protein
MQCLGDGNIPGVTAGDSVPELPHAICKGIEREQFQVELHEIVMRGIRFSRRDVLGALEAP